MKATKSAIKRRYLNVIEIGYCTLHDTLGMATDGRDYHTEGYLGWNADIYGFGDFAICTGYRPFGNRELSHEFCKKWEDNAKAAYNKIYCKHDYSCERIRKERAKFREAFITAVEAELANQSKGKRKAA